MNEFGKKYKIEQNDELGRYVTATTALKEGETLLLEHPVMIIPSSNEKRCSSCFKLTETFCDTCHIIPLCDCCQQHNIFDCNFFANFNADTQALMSLQQNTEMYASLKCLLLRENPETLEYFQKFMQLESHMNERRDTEIWCEYQQKIIEPMEKSGLLNYINEKCDEKIYVDLLHQWCGIIDVNCFEIRAPDVSSMRAIYLNASLWPHNCIANTEFAIDDQYQMKIYANRCISKDEILTNCYTNVLLGTDERRHLLKIGKYFHCQCERCKDPTELGSHMSSLICSPCAANKEEGFIMKNAENEWQCSKCLHKLKTEFVDSILERAKEEIFHAKDDVYRFELLLAKLSRILHPNHYLMLDMKQNIASILRSIIMNIERRPGVKIYERKVRLCQDILTVLNIIQPGLSRLRAIALYELCNTWAELGHIKFEEKEFNEMELLKILKQCESMLRESIRILLYEPIDTPEGKLAKSMLKDLKAMTNDMGLLKDPQEVEGKTETEKEKEI